MNNLLVKFNGEQTPAFLKRIAGRKVCDVTRHKFMKTMPMLETKMPFVQWRGTTETEFFAVTFYGGIVTLDINERELLLGREENVLVVAVVKSLVALNKASKTKDQFTKKLQLNIEYINAQYLKDVETLTFKDIMRIVKWKFVSRKVKENDFGFEDQ